MLSIIICSVSPERLEQVTRNIHDTIGVDYEIIAIDNREKQWPIARAYNEGASRAHYPFLFFVHEDVKFHSVGWGKCIEKKLKEPDCGVIGFAGSKVKLKCYSGWGDVYKWDVIFYYQSVGTETQFRVASVTMEHPFKEVLVLDGFAMFVRKDVWAKYPFDEELLTGFHCYDLDFTLQIAADRCYKNYVGCSSEVLIEHSSQGNFNQSWYQDTIKMHKLKWNKMLPMKIEGFELGEKEMRKQEEYTFSVFLRKLLKVGYPEAKVVLKLDLDRVYRVLDISSCSIQVMKVPEATESAPSSGMAEETAAETSTGAGETNDASGAQDGTEVSGTAASHETEESRRAEVHPAEESSSAQENR